MYLRSVAALQADALFASALQHGDEPDTSQVRRAIALALDAYGGTGCAGRVAQEFGDHPDTAALRMRWVRAAVRDLKDQSIPSTRRIAAPDRRDGGGTGRDWEDLVAYRQVARDGGQVSVLVVGLSHNSAPLTILERAAIGGDTPTKLLADLAQAEPLAEAFVVSTCNRVEVYADVDRFHEGVTAICELLARHCGVAAQELTPYLYVHYEGRAVRHLLAVTSGLDSMVIGDGQIVGQVRSAIKLAGEHGTIGPVLGRLGRVALRAGKRARAETGIGRAGVSLLSVAIELACASIAGPVSGRAGLAGRDVLVVGAGSMGALAVAAASRDGAASIMVTNRTRRRAERLATQPGVAVTRVAGPADLPAVMMDADVVICCTGAAGHVITADMVPAGRRETLVFLDLAMPRDVEPAVADLPGVVVIGLDALREHRSAATADDVAAARAIVAAELAAYNSAIDAARVAPTVVALRARAAEVVDAELARLAGRLGVDGVSSHALDQIAHTLRRVTDKLLHAPTVRVKELAGTPGGTKYAAALRVLFDLDPRAIEAVTRAAPEQERSP